MKRLLLLVLAGAVMVLGVVALAPQSIEMPADYDPAFIRPRIDWREVVAYPPTEPGNAAQPYIQIVREYLRPGPGPRGPQGEMLPPLTRLARNGSRMKDCNFGAELLVLSEGLHRLLPVTSPDDLLGHLSPLRQVARTLRAEGDAFRAAGKVEDTVRSYEAAVILGARLVEGRESFIQMLVGCAIQRGSDQKTRFLENSIGSLYRSEGNDARLQQWSAYYVSLDEFVEKLGNKMRRINAAGETDRKTAKPKDIAFALAAVLHDEDPMIKREAIIALSTLRKPSSLVKNVLQQAEKNDTDPYVREAAGNVLVRMESAASYG